MIEYTQQLTDMNRELQEVWFDLHWALLNAKEYGDQEHWETILGLGQTLTNIQTSIKQLQTLLQQ